ncbi:MAG: M18 family aminopeptidase [Eubacteriales bacterium]|nr:M18 family aminopeptidase [Eubacteriales bacterium]
MSRRNVTEELLEFIEQSPSAFHVIDNMKTELAEAGYRELTEAEPWTLEAGGKYYVTRNESSLIAWQIPDRENWQEYRGFHIAAAHSDSPSFLIKEHPEMSTEKSYIRLNTEKYGGMILSTWLDRPLSVAGRVIVEQDGQMESRLINVDRDLLVIPSMAIHMERKLNQGYEYNPQTDMLPIYADQTGEGSFHEVIAEAADLTGADRILSQELYLYVREFGRIIGHEGEWILSPRLDDAQCVFGLLQGLIQSKPNQYIDVTAVFHNEEVGSSTRQGADSTFLEDVLLWISEAAGEEMGAYRRKLSGSFLLSADNAHALHPNHPEKADPTNRPVLNGGIVLKYHGGQKYTTDAVTGARVKMWCEEAGVPYQTYHNRSDLLGGSTLGNISTSHVSVPSADIGLAQLAMHSAVETAGSRDIRYLIALIKQFYGE